MSYFRKSSDPTGGNRLDTMKAVFDAPKSPFEERMQQGATQLRKASNASSEDNDQKWKRRSVDSDLAQGFQQAAAQQSHRAHERYAAHIPLQVQNIPSGRQSVTSVDSVNR